MQGPNTKSFLSPAQVERGRDVLRLTPLEELKQINTSPCPDFIELLPEKLIDSETGKEVFITQSVIKSWIDTMQGELCPKRFYHSRLIRDVKEEDEEEGTSKDVRAWGKRFEYLLTGDLSKFGEGADPILTAKTGKPSEVEKRIQRIIPWAENLLKSMGFDPSHQSVHSDELRFKCLKGTTDRIIYRHVVKEPQPGRYVFREKQDLYLVDFKFSGQITDNGFSDFSYHPNHIHRNLGARIQSRHYALLGLLLGIFEKVEDVRFVFFAFGSTKALERQVSAVEVEITEEKINAHKWFILNVLKQLQGKLETGGFTAVPSYENCQGCPVKCDLRQKLPTIQKVSI